MPVCAYCEGQGSKSCKYCDGSLRFLGSMEPCRLFNDECAHCESGMIICPVCNGSGNLAVPTMTMDVLEPVDIWGTLGQI